MRVGIIIGVILAILALVVCLIPLKEVAYTVTVLYRDIETYYENEPYEDTETYYEKEPYQDVETYYETEPLMYEVVKSEAYIEGGTPVVSVVVRNEDNVAGIFTIHLYIMCDCTIIKPGSIYIGSKPWFHDKELYLEPNETGTTTYHAHDADMENCVFSSWNYEVTPVTKEVEKERTVTKYRQVEKQRNVTKYKQVERQRTVTKQREEIRNKKVTVLDYLLHY